MNCPQCHKGYIITHNNLEMVWNIVKEIDEPTNRCYEFCSNVMCHLSDPVKKHLGDDREYWKVINPTRIYNKDDVEAFKK